MLPMTIPTIETNGFLNLAIEALSELLSTNSLVRNLDFSYGYRDYEMEMKFNIDPKTHIVDIDLHYHSEPNKKPELHIGTTK